MKLSDKTRYPLYFFIPFFTFLLACAFLQITPFGESSFAIVDMNSQYIDYFSYYKNLFGSENNLFYTFSKTMGGDMTGLAAYYLLSPFNVIFMLFSQPHLFTAVTFVLAAKIGMCGFTCGIFLENISQDKKYIWVFSTSYALMAYNIIYACNTMWTDGVYTLPLVALGIDKIVRDKKPLCYIFALAYALCVNYYIGYMLCIFSVIYFVYRILLSWHKTIAENAKTAAFFAVSSLMAGGLAAMVLLPAAAALSGTKAGFDISKLTLDFTFQPYAIILKLFGGAMSEAELMSGMPNIYCGMLVTLLAVLYFLNRDISIKEKALSFGVCGIIFLSFLINGTNRIWHGFNAPVWFPFRNSFIFSFFLILLAFEGYRRINGNKRWHLVLCAAGFGALSALLCIAAGAQLLSVKGIVFDLLCMLAIISCICLTLYRRKNCVYAICALQLVSLFANCLGLANLPRDTKTNFEQYTADLQEIVDLTQQNDSSFFRTEKDFSRSYNDAMQFGYNGLSHYSSTEKTATKEFAASFGFKINENWVRYQDGSTLTADSILGVKYLISKDGTRKPYSAQEHRNGITLYRNPMALPAGIAADINVADTVLDSSNLFVRQNQIMSAYTADIRPIFTPAQTVSTEGVNIEITKTANGLECRRINADQEAYIIYSVKAASADSLYLYLSADDEYSVQLFVNGQDYGPYFDAPTCDILYIGQYNAGDSAEVALKLNDDTVNITSAQFYHENTDMLKQFHGTLTDTPQTVTKISSSHLQWNGSCSDSSVVVFSIPCEKGWNASVDGKKTDIIPVFDSIIGVEIPAGQHTVDIQFIPAGLAAGAVISIVCLAIILAYIIIKRKKH